MFSALSNNFGNIRTKLTAFVAMGPVTRLGSATNSFFRQMANFEQVAVDTMNSIKIY
jgi:hypothetical protein